LRLERVPINADNETTIGMDFGSAHKPASARPMGHIGCCYHFSAADANGRTNRRRLKINELVT
jgi:hypothetical protein